MDIDSKQPLGLQDRPPGAATPAGRSRPGVTSTPAHAGGNLHLATEGRFLARREVRPGGAGLRRSKRTCKAGNSFLEGPFLKLSEGKELIE